MGLLATLPRATRGHLGASNRTLTRATRGWLQAATAVQVVRRAGGLFITHPEEIECFRRNLRCIIAVAREFGAEVLLSTQACYDKHLTLESERKITPSPNRPTLLLG